MTNRWNLPDLGLGVGLRTQHFSYVLEHQPDVDWFEIISENFMDTGGRAEAVLEEVAARYPIVMHGVSLSIGSTDPLDTRYLERLRALADRCGAVWIGDHLCWTGVGGHNGHDLYPMPYTEESLAHVVGRIRRVQDFLGRPLVIENPSTYLTFAEDTISEAEFIARMANDSDCALLLDVNNVYVTCRNHDLNPTEYLDQLPYDRVVQVHLAGHTDKGTHCIDTHDDHVRDEVWSLYAEVQQCTGGTATLLEWDDNIPEFPVLMAEVRKAERFRQARHEGVHVG
ncbi:MAG: hypothetical protein CL928_18245 [Deltaproteobacteria bacterium]|nr:hypothetical protein [Deltaproteobacteria bacterium]|tara:strand:- start:74 stop:922 length:849 start_codon:yes stop_codon:yes gene_type:complete